MSIMRLNEFKALPGKFEELITRFEEIVAQIRTIEGNESCTLYLKVADGIDEDDKLIVLEVWKDIAAHKNSVSTIDPKQFGAVMALLSERPSGQYYTATDA
ncbi:antibiotic biosynthesis monooxygenase family protein [Asticcacaulis sp.]|uniref:antibiotic biosynthesis monooxygenase family protein n=1 Tax=Asticcacaulis sp. TaxID=1872648 RepID=UPI002D1BA22A|nr:antibiotic biosynthesis monooxygenase family protein [Asticcacaulis sp.]HTM80871.1 antibiotic biosynthesis monooxygenase family protein [Asticcacaulis sp.]